MRYLLLVLASSLFAIGSAAGAAPAPVVCAAAATACAAPARGDSCAMPWVWKPSRSQVRSIVTLDYASSDGVRLRHRVKGRPTADLSGFGQPYNSPGPKIDASAARPGRICSVAGSYRSGARWRLPGTTGQAGRTSFASRFFDARPKSGLPKTIVVRYARRAGQDGANCANPRVVVYRPGHNYKYGVGGDTQAASLRIATDFGDPNPLTGNPEETETAEWKAVDGHVVCSAGGQADGFEAWRDSSGASPGSHTMFRGYRGSHHETTVYLWAAVARSR